ncbi:TPA: hypothetical protein ACY4SF_001218 [Clostridium perfringens]|uniref:hypothetical protein n=1 Tax=Clostridium perfringens TaxID=1502 RepID=UPI0024684C6C|nr:hypothetical protein [Clostridium perfringens]MDM0948203.1 hypothetical protein [Clostridium perfringens]MDM0957058.1 hypothetical protein [Clostridium perfringens]MDM0960366.1 hypothetical protein [Clostridium perfringens]MDM0969052.1 hypothetical protein [Clostridium perfringens]MDM0982691.1 hypothetical protein [Clostridium perfringens]
MIFLKHTKRILTSAILITLITLFSPLILKNSIDLYIEQRVSYFTSLEVVSNIISPILALISIFSIAYSIIVIKNK